MQSTYIHLVLFHPQNDHMGMLYYPYSMHGNRWRSQGSMVCSKWHNQSWRGGLAPSWILCACFISPVEPWWGSNEMVHMKVVLTLKSSVQLLFLINYLGRRWQEWKVKADLSSSLVLFSLLFLQRDAFNYIYRLLLGGTYFFLQVVLA